MSVTNTRTPLERITDALTAHGTPPRGNERGLTARCPAHNDTNPSLSISTGNNGNAVIHCHAGCETTAILAAIGLTTRDLFNKPATNGNQAAYREVTYIRRQTATYDYTDTAGNLLYQAVRYEPKQFRQRRPDGHGGWITNLTGIERVLYRTPDLTAALTRGDTIYIAEGEKDVDALRAAGVTATCNPMGADNGNGNKWLPAFTQTLAGADVVIVADNDQPGHKHARYVATQLEAAGCTVQVVQAAEGKDAADHLAAGHTIDQFQPVDPDTDHEPDDDIAGMFVNWDDFFTKQRGDTDDWAIEDVLARGRGHSIFAKGKTGKSELVLRLIADHITDPTNTDVAIVLDYEMGDDDLHQRLVDDFGYDHNTDFGRLYYAQIPRLPPLDTPAGGEAIDDIVTWVQQQRPDAHIIVVIDTIGRAVDGPENENDTILRFYRHTGSVLRRHEATWARLDHTGHENSDRARGGSAKLDDIDVAWELKRTEEGTDLIRRASRMSWVPEKVAWRRVTDPTITYTRIFNSWPDGTAEVAKWLEDLDVPIDAGRPTARKALEEAGKEASNTKLAAAVRYRKSAQKLSRTALTTPVGTVNADSTIPNPLTCEDSRADSRGQVPGDVGDSCPPLEGGQLSRLTADGLDQRIDNEPW